jgi:hypothetical protein
MAPYNPTPADQWTREDLANAEAAKDYSAIGKARRAGQLQDILSPPRDESDAERIAAVLAVPPVGPTVPGLQPGTPGGHASGSAALMDQAELDRLAANGDYAAINEARRAGRLRHLGA